MTTPAQDAPLVFPAVAFRPVRLFIVCLVLTALAVAAAAFGGKVLYGVFFGVGLLLGLCNALLVRRAVESITAEDHPLKKKMALNSASRLLAITAVALAIAIVFKRDGGLAVLFGLAIFQALLVMSTSIPVLRKIRSGGMDVLETESKDRADTNE
ncbi:ATP synthase subunit I [Mycolicibacterium madagascariense]|uniref:ATP synthase subunit I n=1 Tax=Mycolicibacterium madagascariense TaxID=212765 RepID=UPI0013D3EE78|nr:ATP synthase subunit I [Mycolicibacterium madagascariense]MCV7011573.1 ATP synthase subunit I [Mycolicibacterium madagascariense]